MSLSPALSVGSYTHQYYSQGYLIYQNQGLAGKVCAGQLDLGGSDDVQAGSLAARAVPPPAAHAGAAVGVSWRC